MLAKSKCVAHGKREVAVPVGGCSLVYLGEQGWSNPRHLQEWIRFGVEIKEVFLRARLNLFLGLIRYLAELSN